MAPEALPVQAEPPAAPAGVSKGRALVLALAVLWVISSVLILSKWRSSAVAPLSAPAIFERSVPAGALAHPGVLVCAPVRGASEAPSSVATRSPALLLGRDSNDAPVSLALCPRTLQIAQSAGGPAIRCVDFQPAAEVRRAPSPPSCDEAAEHSSAYEVQPSEALLAAEANRNRALFLLPALEARNVTRGMLALHFYSRHSATKVPTSFSEYLSVFSTPSRLLPDAAPKALAAIKVGLVRFPRKRTPHPAIEPRAPRPAGAYSLAQNRVLNEGPACKGKECWSEEFISTEQTLPTTERGRRARARACARKLRRARRLLSELSAAGGPGYFDTEPTLLIVDSLPSLASSYSEQQFQWAHAITLHAIVGLGLSAGLFVLFLL